MRHDAMNDERFPLSPKFQMAIIKHLNIKCVVIRHNVVLSKTIFDVFDPAAGICDNLYLILISDQMVELVDKVPCWKDDAAKFAKHLESTLHREQVNIIDDYLSYVESADGFFQIRLDHLN